jgi:hypothetical protein
LQRFVGGFVEGIGGLVLQPLKVLFSGQFFCTGLPKMLSGREKGRCQGIFQGVGQRAHWCCNQTRGRRHRHDFQVCALLFWFLFTNLLPVSTIDAMRVVAVGENRGVRARPLRFVRLDRTLPCYTLFEAEGAAMLRLVSQPHAAASHYVAHGFLRDEAGHVTLGLWVGGFVHLVFIFCDAAQSSFRTSLWS